jgi:hypothetical protein
MFAGSALMVSSGAAHLRPRDPVLVVTVADAATGAFIPDVQVRLPADGRVSRTAWNGEVQFAHLGSGMHHVQVRAIGFASGDIDMKVGSDTAGVVFRLESVPVSLDTVRVLERHLSPILEGFVSRRLHGVGRFLADSALQSERTKTLSFILAAHVPGLHSDADTLSSSQTSGLLAGAACPVAVYLDGFKLVATDLAAIRPSELAGIEAYARASAPVAYRPQGNYCHVVLLWTKWE